MNFILSMVRAHGSVTMIYVAWKKGKQKPIENVFLLGGRSMISSTAVGMMSLMVHQMLRHVSLIKTTADLFIDHY